MLSGRKDEQTAGLYPFLFRKGLVILKKDLIVFLKGFQGSKAQGSPMWYFEPKKANKALIMNSLNKTKR